MDTKLTPLGEAFLTSFTVAVTAAVLAAPAGCDVAILSPVGGAINFRDDGPTATVASGTTLPAGLLPYPHWGTISQLSLIASSSSVTCGVMFYKRAG